MEQDKAFTGLIEAADMVSAYKDGLADLDKYIQKIQGQLNELSNHINKTACSKEMRTFENKLADTTAGSDSLIAMLEKMQSQDSLLQKMITEVTKYTQTIGAYRIQVAKADDAATRFYDTVKKDIGPSAYRLKGIAAQIREGVIPQCIVEQEMGSIQLQQDDVINKQLNYIRRQIEQMKKEQKYINKKIDKLKLQRGGQTKNVLAATSINEAINNLEEAIANQDYVKICNAATEAFSISSTAVGEYITYSFDDMYKNEIFPLIHGLLLAHDNIDKNKKGKCISAIRSCAKKLYKKHMLFYWSRSEYDNITNILNLYNAIESDSKRKCLTLCQLCLGFKFPKECIPYKYLSYWWREMSIDEEDENMLIEYRGIYELKE